MEQRILSHAPRRLSRLTSQSYVATFSGSPICLYAPTAWPSAWTHASSNLATRTRLPREFYSSYARAEPSATRRSHNALASRRQSHARLHQYSTHTIEQATTTTAKNRKGESIQDLASVVLEHPSIPTEDQALAALNAIERVAQQITDSRAPKAAAAAGAAAATSSPEAPSTTSPASAMLTLDSRWKAVTTKGVSRTRTTTNSTAAAAAAEEAAAAAAAAAAEDRMSVSTEEVDYLSDMAYSLVTHKPVFITAEILKKYTHIQSLLDRPNSLPEIFYLYAHKEAPEVRNKGEPEAITYRAGSPDASSSAVPLAVANEALEAAIRARSLDLALAIISTSVQTRSYRRARILRRALPPGLGAGLAPVAAWAVASQLSTLQTGLPAESFAQMAFAGMLTYTACVGTVGYVALTTANDQMQRVTWVIGMPLWQRWVREDERAALDRLALAWGLREKTRWGEEEGADWAALKEWVGVRGMILDKVSLMEGME